jgi:hypothetical protein
MQARKVALPPTALQKPTAALDGEALSPAPSGLEPMIGIVLASAVSIGFWAVVGILLWLL